MRRYSICCRLAFVLAVFVCAPQAHSQFTANFQTNTISVVSNWVGNGTYVVGSNTFFNTLRIVSTGVLSNGSGFVGYETIASNSTVLVTDAGSRWTNRFDIYLGIGSMGNRLIVSNQGAVFNGNTYIGFSSTGHSNTALISDTGSVWRVRTNLFLGYFTSGNQLIISNGATVSDLAGTIGFTNAPGNTAWVGGPGSLWSNAISLFVGYNGTNNQLIVTNNGTVFSGDGYVGADRFGSNNTATVTGSGALWRNTNTLNVGYLGSSNSLFITGGGKVFDRSGYIGTNTVSTGNSVLVAGSGSLWSNAANLFVGYLGSGNQLIVTNGAMVTDMSGAVGFTNLSTRNSAFIEGPGSTWSNSVFCYVGYFCAGNELIVSNGATLFSGTGYVGAGSPSSNNTATIAGSGSVWGNTNFLYVGFLGSSNLLVIANGGRANAPETRVGFDPVATNNLLIVTGSGAVLSNAVNTIVGYGGTSNQMIVAAGGMVFDQIGNVGYTNQSSRNTATVTGSGSVWSNTTTMYVGFKSASNRLVVADGGKVFDNEGYIGANLPASNNYATVTGPGALWENLSNLYVGYMGTNNQMRVADGGRVYAAAGTIGFTNFSPRSTVWVTGASALWSNAQYTYVGYNGAFNQLIVSNGGAAWSGFGYIGAFNLATNNVATITGPGSRWTITNALFVGTLASSNALVISDGGSVSANVATYIGFGAASDRNSVLVTGTNSTWVNNRLYLGYDGASNAVTLANGATGMIFDGYNSDLYMGYNPGSISNTVLVTGPGSYWLVANLYVGYSSRSNSLTIANGGSVECLAGHVGYTTGSNNFALVIGSGSKWQNDQYLYVGNGGSRNSLVVSNGGVVSSTYGGYVGYNAGVSNSALVADAGSALTNVYNLYVGYSSRGNSLIISNGGAVHGGYYGSAVGYASSTGANGSNNFASITGSGSVWNNDGSFSVGNGGHSNRLIVALAGKIAASSIFVGANGGTNNLLRLTNGLAQATSVTVSSNNYLTGSGTVTGSLLNNGVVDANINGATLTFSSIVKNNGALRASGGGIMEFYGPVLNFGTTNFTGGSVIFHAGIFSSTGTTNSWIFAGSDLWETAARWSRTVPPSPVDSLVLITNATTKTVTVTASTFSAAPNSVNNFSIAMSGPANVTNTLRIADTPAGTNFTAISFNAGTNTILTISNATVQVGAFGTGAFTAGGELQVQADGQLDTTGVLTSTVANATISGLWTNSVLNIAANGRLSVTNGGKLSTSGDTVLDSNTVGSVAGSNSTLNPGGYLAIGNSGNNNRFTIDGTNASVNVGIALSIGNGASNQVSVINGGGLYTSNGAFVGGGGSNNVMTISGSGSVWTNNGQLIVGYFGPGNQLIITNGGKFVNFGFYTQIGANTGGSNNSVTVTGTNSVWYEPSDFGFYVGNGGSGNRLIVADGGSMTTVYGTIGGGSSNNTVIVTDPGSVWNVASGVVLGGAGGNQFTVTNGGAVVCAGGLVGNGASGSNNLATIASPNSLWRINSTLYVGYGASSNRLEISGGSVVAVSMEITYSDIFAGLASNNLVRLSGGSLFVTNALGNAPLVVGQIGGPASLIFDSGSITVDKLLVTNGVNSIVTFNAGTMHSKSAFITNAQQFVIGDGTGVATYHLLGGIHNFNTGLRVRSNSFLTGCGTINGTVVVDAGGTVVADCSPLVFTGSVTNNGTMRASNGNVLEAYGTVVNNGVIDLINGGFTNFHGAFINNGTILTSNDVRIVEVGASGDDMIVKVQSYTGHDFQLQSRDSMTAGGWADTGAPQPGNGGVLPFTDPGGATNVPSRFYLFRVTP